MCLHLIKALAACMFPPKAASFQFSTSTVRIWRRLAKGSLPQMHTPLPLTSAPIESIFPCRILAGSLFSESPYLLISSYDIRIEAFQPIIETLPGADSCAQHCAARHRRPSTTDLNNRSEVLHVS